MSFSLWGFVKGILIRDETDPTKSLSLEISPSATTGTRTTILVSQTTNRTVNMFDANDTVVGRSTTDTFTNKTFDADGTGNVLTNVDDSNIKAAAAINATKIANGTVDNTEFQYLDGLTSNIQSQIDASGAALAAHIADPTAAHAASAISNIPSGNLAATDVQVALNELQTDIDDRVAGPGSSTDNALVRFDSTTGKLVQNSVAILDDSGALSGLTQLNVDNLQLNGNTLSATSGDLILDGADIDASSNRIKNVSNPASDQDAATKAYVDLLSQGIAWKQSVVVATTANITLSGEQTIDGFLTSSSRVLVKDQIIQTENGVYVSAAGAWVRSTDLDASAEFDSAAVFVSQGTVNADKGWVQTTDNVNLGVSNIVWSQFTGAGSGANTALSNLTNPTAINQDLIPSGTHTLGSTSSPWQSVNLNSGSTGGVLFNSATFQIGHGFTDANSPFGSGLSSTWRFRTTSSATTADIEIYTANLSSASITGDINIGSGDQTSSSGSNNSGNMQIRTGDLTNAGNAGNSGNLTIGTGTVAGAGTRGTLTLDAGTISANSTIISSVANPVSAQDAATKNYTDTNFIANSFLNAKGDLISATADNTPAILTVGSNGLFLKADSTAATGLSWDSPSSILAYRSVTTTDTATTADSLLILSGASFTETLFTAVGNEGKTLRIIHAGTSNTQVYTIDGNGAETIGGAATVKLYQNGDSITIVAINGNWEILNWHTKSVILVAYKNGGAITAVTTIPSWTAETKDSHAAFNLTTGEYTVIVPGDYHVTYHGRQTAANTALSYLVKNGTAIIGGSQITSTASKSVSGILPNLVAGDIITIYHGASATLTSSDTENYLSINLIK